MFLAELFQEFLFNEVKLSRDYQAVRGRTKAFFQELFCPSSNYFLVKAAEFCATDAHCAVSKNSFPPSYLNFQKLRYCIVNAYEARLVRQQVQQQQRMRS